MPSPCRKCGQPVPDAGKQCLYCGTPVLPPAPCVKCGRPVPAAAPRCMYCGTAAPAPTAEGATEVATAVPTGETGVAEAPAVAESAEVSAAAGPVQASPAVSPELELAAAREMAGTLAGMSSRDTTNWETVLLLISFPVVVPTLCIEYLTAKRWGRLYAVTFPLYGGIAALFAFRFSGMPMGLFLLLSTAATVVLWFLRRGKGEEGIFLGYSNSIALRLMIGTGLLSWGCLSLVPWFDFSRVELQKLIVNWSGLGWTAAGLGLLAWAVWDSRSE